MAASFDWNPHEPFEPGQWDARVGLTYFNSGLDITGARDQSDAFRGTVAGDYQDKQLLLTRYLSPSWALRAGWMSRHVQDRVDLNTIGTWEVSALGQHDTAWALAPRWFHRLSAWGNQADVLLATPAFTTGSVTLQKSVVEMPRDQTFELEAGLAGRASERWRWDALVGMGQTQLQYKSFKANAVREACEYSLQVLDDSMVGTRIDPCSLNPSAVSQFKTPLSLYGYNLEKELAWQAQFWRWGVGAYGETSLGTWRMTLVNQIWLRNGVDEAMAQRGGSPILQGMQIKGLWTYPLKPYAKVFVGADFSNHFMLNDLPMLYNSGTSDRFASVYAQYRMGLQFRF